MRFGKTALILAPLALVPAGCALFDGASGNSAGEPKATQKQAFGPTAPDAAIPESDAAASEVARGGAPVEGETLAQAGVSMHSRAGSGDPLADEIESLVQSVMGPSEAEAARATGTPVEPSREAAIETARRTPAVPPLPAEGMTNATFGERGDEEEVDSPATRATDKKPLDGSAAATAPNLPPAKSLEEQHTEQFPQPLWRRERDRARAADPASHDLPRGK